MTASHDEFQANFSIAVPVEDQNDEPTVTGVTSGSRQMVRGEREQESAMDGRGPRGW